MTMVMILVTTKEIMDEFGTMEDFDRLLKGVHDRGMKLILDLVVNHTSE